MDVGQTWKGWYVAELLGEGGFGKVFKIVRRELGHEYCSALKLVRIPNSRADYDSLKNQGMSDYEIKQYFDSVVIDFSKELKIMDSLKAAPNIVGYQDHVIEPNPDGIGYTIYMRMELLTPLQDYIRQRPLSEREVVKVGIDMCDALEACRKYNIIHRDIKPANIFISEFGDCKLGDFGVARKLERTQSGLSSSGTPNFMAPEVYRGLPYNHTVDIYSLGIVLFSLLNDNRTPFLPPYPQTIMYNDVEPALIRRMNGEPIPKPRHASSQMAAVIQKACAYDPKYRYQSASELKRALRQVGKPQVRQVDERKGSAAEHGVNYVMVGGAEQEQKKQVVGKQNPQKTQNTQKKQQGLSVDSGKKLGIAAAILAIILIYFIVINPYHGESVLIGSSVASNSKSSSDDINSFNVKDWNDITQISAGESHIVALKKDGTVLATGNRDEKQCSVKSWSNITAIDAGGNCTVGVKKNGTVVATGANDFEQCEVGDWSNIISVAAGGNHTVGLRDDGTVVAAGNNLDGQCDVKNWKNIEAVAAGDFHTVGLKSDGTVVAIGDNKNGECNVKDWKDIKAVAACYGCTFGLKENGTVVAAGNTSAGSKVNDWSDVTAIDASGVGTVVAQKKDGTFSTDRDTSTKPMLDNWKNVKLFSAGDGFAVGVEKNNIIDFYLDSWFH